MQNNQQSASYVHLEATYPHELLLCLKKITNGKKDLMQDEILFLQIFQNTFPDHKNEWKLLKLAYEQNLIDDFFEADQMPQWCKRVILKKSLRILIKIIIEKYAVLLLESLMFIFHWEFSMKIKRSWENTRDEQAHFHEKVEIHSQHTKMPVKVGEHDNIALAEAPKTRNTTTDSNRIKTIREEQKERPHTKRKTEGHVTEQKLEQHVTEQEPEQVKFYCIMSSSVRRTLKKALCEDVRSQCEIGAWYADCSSGHLDYQEAIRWYEAAAEKGYERAQFELGKLYEINNVAGTNGKEKALEIYQKLANQGYPTAQCVLGMKYRLGDGVEENPKLARKWLEKAALQRHESAIRNLADLYQSIGDRINAQKWYSIGAANGDNYCKNRSSE